MTLTTAATVTVDRLRYTAQIRSVSVELTLLPGVSCADVLLAAGVEVEARPGSEARVELDGGDGGARVITGTVDHVDRQAAGTTVSIVDGGAALARIRPQETYNGLAAMQVVGRLARLAGVQTGTIAAALQTSAYVADPHRTGAQHVADLARRAGSVAAIGADGRLSVLPWPVGLPSVAMRRDREFTALSTSAHQPQHEFALVGSGGSAAALGPDAWLVNTDAVTHAEDPDATRTWLADPVLRTAVDVDLANRGSSARRVAATRRFRGECWLQPARRPGDVVEIAQTEHAEQAGPWLLTTVRHELGWDRSRTVLLGVSGGGASGLLGALAGLGSLL